MDENFILYKKNVLSTLNYMYKYLEKHSSYQNMQYNIIVNSSYYDKLLNKKNIMFNKRKNTM